MATPINTHAYALALDQARHRLDLGLPVFDEHKHKRDAEGQFAKAYSAGHTALRTLSGGFNEDKPTLVKLSNGQHAVVKDHVSAEGASKDVLASKLGQALGIKGAQVEHASPTRTVGAFIQGESGAKQSGSGRFAGIGIDLPDHLKSAPGTKEIALLDWLIDNKDRHGENWLVAPDGRVMPVDHDKASFNATRGDEGGGKKGPWELVPNHDFVTHHLGVRTNAYGELTGLKPNLTKDEVASVRTALESVRPDFEAANRLPWYDEADRRLQMLEKKVKRAKK